MNRILVYLVSTLTLPYCLVLGSIVQVQNETVQFVGVQNSTARINTFRGIKYAESPSGSLRWRPPVPVRYGEGSSPAVVDATIAGPSCIQSRPFWSYSEVSIPQSEDCLLLNVQTPAFPKSKMLPVLVYIHGGGYTVGDAVKTTGDSILAQSDGTLIYVALQYRLGPLGFMAGQDVQKDGTPNVGLLDQRAGIQWVRDNIALFGGDPDRITISGDSAGGGSVTMQMVMYGGVENPPFTGAISEYTWWTPMYDDKWQQEQYLGLLRAAKCDSLHCLRELPASALRSATREASKDAYLSGHYAYGTYYWGPVVDGHIIVRHPVEEFRDGRFSRVPVVVTHTFDEGFIFTNYSLRTENDISEDLKGLWHDQEGHYTQAVLKLYPQSIYNTSHLDSLVAYPLWGKAGALEYPLSDAFVRRSSLFGDALVSCPTRHIAKSVADVGTPVYKLIFNAAYQFHGAMDGFLRSNSTNSDGTGSPSDELQPIPGNSTLAELLRGYWISFATFADPNYQQFDSRRAPRWLQYMPENGQVLHIDAQAVRNKPDPDKSSNCQFFQMGRGNSVGIWPQW